MRQHDNQVNPSSRNVLKWMFGTAGLILLVVLVAIGYSRRTSNREQDLRGKSTDNLQLLEARQDADALVHFVYAQRLFDSGKSAEAVAPIARAVMTLPKSEQTSLACRIWALAGCIAADSGRDAQAEDALRKAEAIRREDLLVYLGRGILEMRQERLADAVSSLTMATRIDSAYCEPWRRLGKAYMQGAELELALQAFRRAAALHPNDPAIHLDIGQGLLQEKQLAAAEIEYKTAASLLPADPYYSTMPIRILALSARSDADYARAAGMLQTALSRLPNDDGLRAELAGLYMRSNQFKLARQELETILTHNPMISTDAWYCLYTVCKRLGDQKAAEEAHTQFQQTIDLKNAATELMEQAQMHPTDARLFLHLSIVLLGLRQIDNAYAVLKRAAALDPNDPEIAHAMESAQIILRSRQGSGGANGGGGTLP